METIWIESSRKIAVSGPYVKIEGFVNLSVEQVHCLSIGCFLFFIFFNFMVVSPAL